MNRYSYLLENQKKYIKQTGGISVDCRIDSLKKLRNAIKKYEDKIVSALESDLGKHSFEAYLNEVAFVYDSIDYAIKNVAKWSKPKRVRNDLAQFLAKSIIYPSHYGSVLIIGPFNYPFQLVMDPLVGAISGGNAIVLKPSNHTPATEEILSKLISETFEENYIAIVSGDRSVNNDLLDLHFDYIFFTGSVKVGQIVMEKASKYLVPFTLELGGKSPAIVDSTANLKLAAKRIAWGKFLNAGQTCVAPDYVLAHRDIASDFLKELKTTILEFYGNDTKNSPDYGRIVSEKHTERLSLILNNDREKLVFGGDVIIAEKFISPTILFDASLEDDSMQDEIFGPILPILIYENFEDIEKAVESNPNPLSLYIFSESNSFSNTIIQNFSFGGGCINDTILHVASKHLPFGGIGSSGTGQYHGKSTFETFTYKKSIVKKSSKFTFNPVFPPYGDKLKWIKKFIK